ncbi:MAG: hypothetical protein ABSA21_13625 [Candidatus Limnocylindrales bacterium]
MSVCRGCRPQLRDAETVVWAAKTHGTSTQEGQSWDEGSYRVFFHPACAPPGFPASYYKLILTTTLAQARLGGAGRRAARRI